MHKEAAAPEIRSRSTSASLLEWVKARDGTAWVRFVNLCHGADDCGIRLPWRPDREGDPNSTER